MDEINEILGSDSLGYLSIDGLMESVGMKDGCCLACFDGNYPMEVPRLDEEEAEN